jgi:hypothetical protein
MEAKTAGSGVAYASAQVPEALFTATSDCRVPASMTGGQSLRSYSRVNIVGRGVLADKPVTRCGHSLIRTAYHEAGHALLAHLHGFRIMWVTIIPDVRTLGRMRSMDWDLDYVAANQPERLIWAVIANLSVKLAGPLAELVLDPGANRRDGNDYNAAREIMRYARLSAHDEEAIIERCEATVLRGLRVHWSAVRALVAALLEDGRIEGLHAHEIFTAG